MKRYLSFSVVLILTLAALCAQSATVTLVNHTNFWQYHKGTNAPQSGWQAVPTASLDASWLTGRGGFGYGDSDDATVLSDMINNYRTVYIRQTFTVTSALDSAHHIFLTMDWDDGFVAYLDGAEIKRALAPGAIGVEPAHDALATGLHEASRGGTGAQPPTTYDLGAVGAQLEPGEHVLAVMGLNEALDSSDLSLIADLYVAEPPPVVSFLVNHTNLWRYRKGVSAPQAGWQSIANASLDGSWLTGPGGFGYADNDDATVLTDMRSNYTTICIRQAFETTSALDTNLHIKLTVDYDDGFVAYLDGAEVARDNAPGSVGSEPAFDAQADTDHEASAGGGGAPTTYELGRIGSRLQPGIHVLALVGLNDTRTSSDLSLIADLFLGNAPTNEPGLIAVDTVWSATNGPYVISGNLTVANGVTLTIEPGVTVLFNQGVSMTINGRLLAEGTAEEQIRFTRNAGATSWSGLVFTANSVTSRIAHAEMSYFAADAIEATGTTMHLESIIWTNSTADVVDLHSSSITLLNSFIPGGAGSEPVHFSTMPANGHALIQGCLFGAPRGYNDSIDFTGGNRPGPIVQFIDNIFLAGVDDCFDMDATDAHIEGNIFMNVLQDDERESSSNPISTGEGSATSELVICRNIFYNCEHTLLLKDGGSGVMQNNTIVRLVTNALARTAAPPGGQLIPPGIILFGEPWRSGRTPGTGAIYDGNIAHDLHPIIQATPFPLYDPADSFLIVSHSLIQGNNWPGVGNISADPMFVNPAGPMTAQNIRSNLALLAGSPCTGTGPNGLDMGALVPAGASISGEPASPTTQTNVTLRVAGPGIVAYRWKLNEGPWSAEISLTNTILITTNYFNPTNGLVHLNNLTNGTYTLYAIGKNSAGAWQGTNSPCSKTWTVSAETMLRITSASRAGNEFTLRFIAEAGKTYTVQACDSLTTEPWVKLTDVPAQPSTGDYAITDSAASGLSRFYRIVTPAQ